MSLLCNSLYHLNHKTNIKNIIKLTFTLSILIFTLILITACETAPKDKNENKTLGDNRPFSFWPLFPAEPRIQFLTSFKVSSDIEEKASAFERLVVGQESEILPIVKPYGIEMYNGKIYVCDIRNSSVTVLDLRKKETRIIGTKGINKISTPNDIAISSDGTIYVADGGRGVILVYNNQERYVNTLGHQDFRPIGIAVQGDELYVCDSIGKRVEVMNRYNGQVLRYIGEPGVEDGQFSFPLGIDVDKEGNVYVADVLKCNLQKFSPEGEVLFNKGQIGDSAGNFARAKHLAVDNDNIIYVVDATFNNVQMFNDQGEILMYFGSAGDHDGAMNLPAGICTHDTDIDLFQPYVHSAFEVQRLILVTNQFGPQKVAVYGLGHLRPGKTAQDLAEIKQIVPTGLTTGDDEFTGILQAVETPVDETNNNNNNNNPENNNDTEK